MFVAHSTARVRAVRAAFVLAGLIPTLGIVAWAAHLRSESHRESVRLAWQRAVGLPLVIGRIETLRPGVVRAHDCRLTASEGADAVACGVVEVEASATEVRLRVDRLRCDPAAARVLGFLAREWLERGARFERNCIVEVADFAWSSPLPHGQEGDGPAGEGTATRVRIECVSQASSAGNAESRAVRIVRRAGSGGGQDDEVRIVREPDVEAASVAGGAASPHGFGERIDVEGRCTEPVPFDVLAAFATDSPLAAWSLGRSAAVMGALKATRVQGTWSIDADGRIEAIDLAACLGGIGVRADGTAVVALRRCAWREGCIAAVEFEAATGPGHVERRFLDAAVGTLGCRPGPAYASLAASTHAGFDAAELRISIDRRGVACTSGSRLAGAIAVSGGQGLIEPPAGIVSADRLAWLVARPGTASVPAGGPGGWLMRVMPRSGTPPERTSRTGGDPGRGF